MATHGTVLSLRISENEKEGLERLARRQGRTVSELAARMILEGRRRAEFAWIDFRDTPPGRMAYLQNTRLQVWWIARLARQWKSQKVADHLEVPLLRIKAALNYASAFPEEIQDAITDYESITVEDIKRQLPELEVFEADKPAQLPSRK